MDRYINRILRTSLGRIVRSPETGGYALPEAYDTAKNTVFFLKPLYPGEEPSVLFGRFGDETRYVQGIFREAFNHPCAVHIDHYEVPFSPEQKQRALRSLVDEEGGMDRLMTELEVSCDDEAPFAQRWDILATIIQEGRSGNPLLMEKLARLLSSEVLSLRLLAIEAIGTIGDSLAAPSLFKLLHEDQHPDVRAMAGVALGKLNVQAARLPLLRRALQSSDGGEQHDLFSALALLGGPDREAPGLSLRAEYPNDSAPEVRAAVITSVTEGVPGLAAALHDPDTQREYRLACLSLLELVSPEDALPILLPLFDDPDEPVAAQAAEVGALLMAELGPTSPLLAEAIKTFQVLLTTSHRPRCRAMAAAILGRVGDKSIIDLLDRRGLGDPDLFVRDTAERARKRAEDRIFGFHRERSEGDIGLWARTR